MSVSWSTTKSRTHPRAKSSSSIPIHTRSGTGTRRALINATSFNNSGGTGATTRKSVNFSNSKSLDFSNIESEYIRNLQQQIYFLELECEYLNAERNKLVTVPSAVTLEAERMISRVKSMQVELQHRERDILDKESTINILQHHKENTLSKLEIAEESHSSEKKEYINQIVKLKKQVERHELDATKTNIEHENISFNFNKALEDLKATEVHKNNFQFQLHEKTEDFNNLRVLNEEKRSEFLKLQTEFQELEDRFFRSKTKAKEEEDQKLKEQIKQLRYELREKELQAEQDRTLRLRISDDCGALVKENAALSTQSIEYQKQLDLEKQFNEDSSYRKQVNIQELVTLREEQKHNERELQRCKELLQMEQDKYRMLLDKFTSEEEGHTRAKLQRSKLKAELDEVVGQNSTGTEENTNLRRDNLILSDHMNELKDKVRRKDDEIDTLQTKVHKLQIEYTNIKSKYRLQSSFDQIKWDEFEQMADQMKTLSRNLSPIRSTVTNVSPKYREVDLDS